MPIIGTAGHVDHGKSALVRALTGIDPDRLAEEKRRGMTIDLGFAHLDLPSGERVGIVDVPGHARFLPNMLAGVHGLDVVLLVVAADEGVMPQTREHLDILGLLGVGRIVVALTKVDLVDADVLALVEAEIRAELGRRHLDARVIPVASTKGYGVEDVRSALTDLVAEVVARDAGRPRLPVDRAFTMPGFGTVVTGSLVDGPVRVGQELELVPGRGSGSSAGKQMRVRVRGLQQHGRQVEDARPGSRVAANLQGVERDDVRRGQVLAPPGTLAAADRIDLRLRVLESAGISVSHNARVAVHSGTAETRGRVTLLEGDALGPGEEGWVQLKLAAPLAIRDGDVVVLRRPSPPLTIAGGRVVDASPAAHRRNQSAVVDSLQRRQLAGGRLLEELGRARHGTTATELASRLAMDAGDAGAALGSLTGSGKAVLVGDVYFGAERWLQVESTARRALQAFHRRHPTWAGMPRERLRSDLDLSGRALANAIDAMLERGVLEAPAPDLVALPGWTPQLTPAQQAVVAQVLEQLSASPLSPPRVAELAEHGLDASLRHYLEEQGLVLRVASDLVMLPDAVRRAQASLRHHLEEKGATTVAEARDVLGSSRRTVVPLLEYFDAIHFTRRDGDLRRLRRTDGDARPAP